MAAESSRTFADNFEYGEEVILALINSNNNSVNDGWKTVSYKKKRSSSKSKEGSSSAVVDVDGGCDNELKAEERRKRMLLQAGKGHVVVDDDEKNNAAAAVVVEMEKKKAKKPKKVEVTVSEAASQIDSSHLAACLDDINVTYYSKQDEQLLMFADYFGQSFAKVSGSQFLWINILKDSSVDQMVHIPISEISDDVLETCMNWLYQKSPEAIASFVISSLDNLVYELDLFQGQGAAAAKTPAKSQVAIFLVLAMVLRYKPDVLITLLPLLKDKYQSHEKLNLAVWVITQATEGDMAVGMFMWVHFLLPMLDSCTQSNENLNIDLILQVVERILALPNSRFILAVNAVRMGERFVSPLALEVLLRLAYPDDSSRLKETERFEAIYPALREVAVIFYLPGSIGMSHITKQILPFTLKATGQGVPDLAKEGAELFIWCLVRNPDCYQLWDDMYLDNIEASVEILKILYDRWTFFASKHSDYDPLKKTLRKFMLKNKKGLASESINTEHKVILKESQKHCKKMLSRLTSRNPCVKVSVLVAMAIGAIAISATYWAFNDDGLSVFLLN